MKRLKSPDRILDRPRTERPRTLPFLGLALLLVTVLLLAYLAWPYATLWRIDRALRKEDSVALAELVDLDAIRGAIKTKLNKDADSSIGDLSDSFIRWLQEGLGVRGSDAVEQLVTLGWVRERLLDQGASGDVEGFLGRISYAFFNTPDGFVARIGAEKDTPIHVHLKLRDLGWRVSAVYF